ncbi:MAG: hypothetical protein EOP84_08830 [Verrucomicrobiaceae bacterium]|nr:MAG: hypothetical protein EOP84_08830 [Verrucomicrobiaceae bacterium]
MAEITEKMQVPDAVDWRQRVAELKKDSGAAAVAWAEAALRAGRTVSAQQALESVPEKDRNTARYHAAAGATAISTGQLANAERHFTEAVKLEPSNEVHRYNLATFQIQSPDDAKRKTGTETLETLGGGGRVELYARRSRVTQLRGEKKEEEALRVSGELLQLPNVEFADRLKHLELLYQLKRPEWQAFAEDLRKQSLHATGEDVAALATWTRENIGAAEALTMLTSLPPDSANHPRVSATLAETLVALKQWPELKAFVSEGNWDSLDYLRLAYMARAFREMGDPGAAHTRWTAAIGAARKREPLSQLAWTAARWGWTPELREVLWAAANTPAPQWALQMLHRSYLSEKDTAGVLRVAQKALEADAQSASAQNNVAALSLLLRRDQDRARETARQLHEKMPENPYFASTYALGLHLAGRSAEGLEILKKYKREQLREPSLAAYYGVLLAVTGAKAEAQEFLELGEEAPLLPEELALLTAAREAVTR